MPLVADVVEPADERADEGRAGLRGEQRLRRREAQRDVDADAFARQRLARLDAVARQRHLDDHVLVDRRDVVPLLDHAGEVGRGHLAADRALDDLADLLQVLAVVARLLRQQRRVGRDAVDDADGGQRFDVLDVAGVDEEFHGQPLHLTVALSIPTGFVELADAFDVDRHDIAGRERADA